ncbi:hypothetical protein [Sphingobium ummariense]
MNSVRLMSRGRVYGSVASILLTGYFVAPPVADLSIRACDGSLICPTKVEQGIYEVFVAVTAVCLISGFLISREIDKYPSTRNVIAAAIFAVLTAFFGGAIWLMLRAAFW